MKISRMRRRLFIDQQVQGVLVHHLIRCWLLSVVTMGGITLAGWMFIHPGLEAFVGPHAFITEVLPMMLVGMGASLLLLPILLWRLVAISHRFVGPVCRLRRVMEQVADGGELKAIHFRRDDYWCDIAESYNAMLEHFRQIQAGAVPLETSGADRELPPAQTVPIGIPATSLVQAWPLGQGGETPIWNSTR